MANDLNNAARAHLRLRFTEGVLAEIRLMDQGGQLLSPAMSTVLLLNMSQDGLCFLSGLQLPVQQNYMVEFKMFISNIYITVKGCIVWRSMNDNDFVYGVTLQCSLKIRSLVIQLMNYELLIQQPERLKMHHMYRSLSARNRVNYGGLPRGRK